jgi:undecaprenyl-diphosphatase
MDHITIVEALFLGLVQGFTEWLPISSSGHLVIFESLLGISVPADWKAQFKKKSLPHRAWQRP